MGFVRLTCVGVTCYFKSVMSCFHIYLLHKHIFKLFRKILLVRESKYSKVASDTGASSRLLSSNDKKNGVVLTDVLR